MGKRVELVTQFKAAYVPLPPEMVEARRASLLLLLQWVDEEIKNEREGFDRDRGRSGIWSALFPMAVGVGSGVAKAGGLHAWFVGHDGSAVRVAYGSR
jgi:hypothetical protein